MAKKDMMGITTCCMIASIFVLSILGLGVEKLFAESQYKMADGVSTTITFTFKDGIETHMFPVFKMTSDFVSNVEPTFKIQGVVGEAPHLHKALDDSFRYRTMASGGMNNAEYNYRFFDVQVNILKDTDSVRTINYYKCEVLNYNVGTEKDDYESYGFFDNVGFTIVDEIEFRCNGITLSNEYASQPRQTTNEVFYEYGQTSFKFAEDARTFVTFKFDEGTERIEFPIFELVSGFKEGERSGPSFHVEGIVMNHPILDNTVNQSRKLSGLAINNNPDFEAIVEFTNGGDVVRGFEFVDCRVGSYLVDTYQDKEEGYTGKRGFALIETADFTCSGLKPLNPTYYQVKENQSVLDSKKLSNEYLENFYNMGTGPHAIAKFTFNDNSVETIDFPVFQQESLQTSKNPSFEFVGVPGKYPFLYKAADAQKMGPRTSGINLSTEFFDVNVNLAYDANIVRQLYYSSCHVTDYVVKTQHDKEESFFKGFALTNEFHLECLGYSPNNPIYEKIFDTHEKTQTISTKDLRNTDSWGPQFRIQ